MYYVHVNLNAWPVMELHFSLLGYCSLNTLSGMFCLAALPKVCVCV